MASCQPWGPEHSVRSLLVGHLRASPVPSVTRVSCPASLNSGLLAGPNPSERQDVAWQRIDAMQCEASFIYSLFPKRKTFARNKPSPLEDLIRTCNPSHRSGNSIKSSHRSSLRRQLARTEQGFVAGPLLSAVHDANMSQLNVQGMLPGRGLL